jgi:multimeric flavodoxin WrbA
VGRQIKKIEKDQALFDGIISDLKEADGIIWTFPLYVLLVPSNLKRFIELIFEREATGAFKDKYTAAISTSIHFFDNIAHNYIHAICDDLDMKYLGYYSADMHDLLIDKKRKEIEQFMSNIIEGIKKKSSPPKYYGKVPESKFKYKNGGKNKKIKESGESIELIETKGRKILIVSDVEGEETNLVKMITQFKESFSEEIEEVNLREIDIKGGCRGCIQCAYDNQCFYIGKDDFVEFYEEKVKKADILIFAGEIKDRYLSSRWKMFFDRSFYNTHIPVLAGKQIGFIISGPLRQNENLREKLRGWSEVAMLNIIDFVTDEDNDSIKIDQMLNTLAFKAVQFSTSNYQTEITMRGFGGKVIFRDAIWGRLRFPFRADFKYYKKHKFFDFPQKRRKVILVANFMLLLSRMKGFRKEVNKRMNYEMVKRHKKLVEES